MTHPNNPPFDPEYVSDATVPPEDDQPAADGQRAAAGQPRSGGGRHAVETDAGQQEMIGATGSAQDSGVEKDPAEWVSGDEPMTEAQKSYLDTLAKQAGEQLPASLTKAEASQHIDRLKKATGN